MAERNSEQLQGHSPEHTHEDENRYAEVSSSGHSHGQGHGHSHEHTHDHSHGSPIGGHHHGPSNIVMAFWLNFVFTILEIIGGVLTNSVAILSDAVHDLGDSIALVFAILMERVGRKGRNENLTFGFRRFELLGAFINSLILISGSVFVLYTAISRVVHVEEVNAPGMLIMSIVGILFNGMAVLRMRRDEGLNARVVYMHLLEDVLGWVSILLVSIVMMFVDLPILDPILSIVIAVFILSRIIPTLLKVARIFLQYKPDDIEIVKIRDDLEVLSAVRNVHDIHLWTLDGINHIFTCHVLADDSLSSSEVLSLIAEMRGVLKGWGIHHATIEPEFSSDNCTSCDLPDE